jgi:hypothetical protein
LAQTIARSGGLPRDAYSGSVRGGVQRLDADAIHIPPARVIAHVGIRDSGNRNQEVTALHEGRRLATTTQARAASRGSEFQQVNASEGVGISGPVR